MKRLFKVVDRNGKTVQGSQMTGFEPDGGFKFEPLVYMESKKFAKQIRDAMNETKGKGHTVALGPDHWRAK